MDQPEMQPQPTPQTPGLVISQDARSYWPGIRNWSLFLAVAGFCLAALIGLIISAIFYAISKEPDLSGSPQLNIALLAYVAMFASILAFSMLLLLYSNSMGRAARYGHADDIKRSSLHQLRYFRMLGILSALYLLAQAWWFFSLIQKLNSLPF